jgi:ABC-2 type transport system ATP-binding protein
MVLGMTRHLTPHLTPDADPRPDRVRRPDPGPAQHATTTAAELSPAVEVVDLAVVRGGRTVLEGISTVMSSGSITGLLGPSGSGKTTFLRAVVGVQRLSAGTVTVLGAPAGSPALRRAIGYVTQAASVYEDLTVLQNVRYFASLYGRGRRHPAAVVEDVGLGAQAGQLVRSLSGGQRSRCSLACALVADPKVLVLDEPTAGQDPLVREQLWAQFRELADCGVAIIVSSHVMAEAARCDQLLLIRDGRVAAAGTPAQLRNQTGAEDMDQVFLTLARAQAVA